MMASHFTQCKMQGPNNDLQGLKVCTLILSPTTLPSITLQTTLTSVPLSSLNLLGTLTYHGPLHLLSLPRMSFPCHHFI